MPSPASASRRSYTCRHLAWLAVIFSCGACTPFAPQETRPLSGRVLADTRGSHFIVSSGSTLWWTSEGGSTLARVDQPAPARLTTARVPLDYSAFGLTAGFGAIWLAEGGAHPTIHKLHADTGAVLHSTRLATFAGRSGRACYVAAGEEAVWAGVNVIGKVFRLDPDSGAITAEIDLGRRARSHHLGRLAAGAGGVWVIDNDAVHRIDPERNRVSHRIALPGLFPAASEIVTGSDTVWVGGGSSIRRINPRTNAVTATINLDWPPAQPSHLRSVGHLVFARGRLWALVGDFDGSFTDITRGAYQLISVDPRDNSICSVQPLAAGDAANRLFGPTFVIGGQEAWVCLPCGVLAIPLP